jgi:hypothetical protein
VSWLFLFYGLCNPNKSNAIRPELKNFQLYYEIFSVEMSIFQRIQNLADRKICAAAAAWVKVFWQQERVFRETLRDIFHVVKTISGPDSFMEYHGKDTEKTKPAAGH